VLNSEFAPLLFEGEGTGRGMVKEIEREENSGRGNWKRGEGSICVVKSL